MLKQTLLTCILSSLILVLNGCHQTPPPQSQARFIAFGDMPYQSLSDEIMDREYKKFEALIDVVNHKHPHFAVHIGDIKHGEMPCSDDYYTQIFNFFNTIQSPFIYIPGDNDWTDCHRKDSGSYDPLERLAKVRDTFFLSQPHFEKTITLTHQSDDSQHPEFKDYIENVMWTDNHIVYVTLHTVGKNNNLPDNSEKKDKKNEGYGNTDEYQKRNTANMAWLKQAYQQATSDDMKGLVIFTHADPFFEKKPKKRTGMNDLIETLYTQTTAFNKPVLLVHGSTHEFKIDKPLIHPDSKSIVANFTRVLVFGEQDVHAVAVDINLNEPDLFTIKPVIIKANIVKP